MEHLLEKRVQYFLTSRFRGRAEVRQMLQELKDLGQLVIIGGMLRDLALFGNASFQSDLDLVIDPVDPDFFEKRMSLMGAAINRFGGYSLSLRRWRIDIWPLHRTWAHVAGHIAVRTFDDLKGTTFFDCDAILYDISTNKLHTKQGYFDQLRRRVIEINLRPNPNPRGNAVRAFRYAILKGFQWGPRLTQFVAEMIDEAGWGNLVNGEKKSFNSIFIATLNRRQVESELDRYFSGNRVEPFVLNLDQQNAQLKLPLAYNQRDN